ncbi:MAG: regulatory protein RecX [Candidatus Berkiellales bacterium]
MPSIKEKEVEDKAIKEKAIALLARREHSRRELQQKLTQRGYAFAAIDDLLNELEKSGLLNEDRFIGSIIRTYRSRGMGPLKICVELQKRGIDRSRIVAHEEWHGSSWDETAIAVRIKRFGELLPSSMIQKMQQIRFLQQRGFTQDQIHVALKCEIE